MHELVGIATIICGLHLRSVEELEMLYVVQGQRRHTMVRLEERGTEKVGVDSRP